MKANSLKTAPYRLRWTYVDENGGSLSEPRILGYALQNYVYPSTPANTPSVEWRDNVPFDAELEIVGWGRGRSSVTFEFENTADGTIYPMFVSDVYELMSRAHIQNGRVRGVWQVVKRGKNFGLMLVDPGVSE